MGDFFYEIAANSPLRAAVLAWFMAQAIKFIIEIVKQKRLSLYILLFSTGGMPSSHSAFVTALMVSVGLTAGWGSGLFAVSAVVAMVTMADAAGVRRAAGKQAAALNMLIEHLDDPNVSLDKKLRELLGHTPVEVAAGAALGMAIAFFLHQHLLY